MLTVAFALAAPSAGASTYCAGATGADCSVAYPATGAGLKSALLAADTNIDIGGTPDVVRIGPGTYASATGFTTSGGDISVVGAGETTILTAADVGGPTNAIVLNVLGGSPAASVSNLQIRMAGAAQDGGIWGFSEVSDVHVGGPGTLNDTGILLPSAGGRVTRALIDPAAMNRAAAINGKSMTVQDTLIRVVGDGGPFETYGVLAYGPVAPGSADVALRHVTILGNGATNAAGIRLLPVRAPTGTTSVNLHLRDSLLHGLAVPLALVGQAADTSSVPCKGNCYDALANADTRYSSLAAASVQRSGPGAYAPGLGDLPDPEPLLAADGTPLTGSPLANAGDPGGPETGESATDLAGNPRIQFGRRDIGALESAIAPLPAAVAGPTAPAVVGTSPNGPPVISGLSMSRRRFRVGAAPRRGSTIRFSLSAPAGYKLRVERVLGGRLLVRRGKPSVCRLKRAGARVVRGRRCTTRRLARTLSGTSRGGPVSVRLTGLTGRTRLPAGAYRLTVEALDEAGAVAAPQRLRFTVVR